MTQDTVILSNPAHYLGATPILRHYGYEWIDHENHLCQKDGITYRFVGFENRWSLGASVKLERISTDQPTRKE